MKKISLSTPNLCGNEWTYIKKCLDDNFVSSAGQFVDEFENQFTKYLGVKNAIAVMNGTSALHMSLLLSGVSQNDEVLVPNLTFVAPLNAVSYLGAHPVLLDSSWDSLGLCPLKLKQFLEKNCSLINGKCFNKKTERFIKAIIPMHTLGTSVDMNPILDLSKKYQLKVVEDASEALGAMYKNKFLGTLGDFGCYSFNGNKIITSGGGGMIVTNNESLAKKAKHISSTAKVSKSLHFVHDEIGYNYRMVNILAALGLAQFENLDYFLNIKRRNAEIYFERLKGSEKFNFFMPPNNLDTNHWFYALILKDDASLNRDKVIDFFIKNGIDVRPLWTLMEDLPMYKGCFKGDLKTSREIRKRVINLPCSTSLKEEDIHHISNIIETI